MRVWVWVWKFLRSGLVKLEIPDLRYRCVRNDGEGSAASGMTGEGTWKFNEYERVVKCLILKILSFS